jgi:hypothetical protein
MAGTKSRKDYHLLHMHRTWCTRPLAVVTAGARRLFLSCFLTGLVAQVTFTARRRGFNAMCLEACAHSRQQACCRSQMPVFGQPLISYQDILACDECTCVDGQQPAQQNLRYVGNWSLPVLLRQRVQLIAYLLQSTSAVSS